MDTETQNIIRSRYQELPPEVRKAINATDLSKKFDIISQKYSLRIDQSGNLQTETILVMLGLEKPTDYIDNLVSNAEMNRGLAEQIATDVNTEILGSIRATLEKITSDETENNSDLEKVAGINVEKNQASEDVVSGKTNPTEQISKARTLNAIENPPAFIDRLLTGSSSSVNETVIKQASLAVPANPTAAGTETQPKPASTTSSTIPAAPKIDPYREPIE